MSRIISRGGKADLHLPVLVIFLLAFSFSTPPAHAATITVNTKADELALLDLSSPFYWR